MLDNDRRADQLMLKIAVNEIKEMHARDTTYESGWAKNELLMYINNVAEIARAGAIDVTTFMEYYQAMRKMKNHAMLQREQDLAIERIYNLFNKMDNVRSSEAVIATTELGIEYTGLKKACIDSIVKPYASVDISKVDTNLKLRLDFSPIVKNVVYSSDSNPKVKLCINAAEHKSELEYLFLVYDCIRNDISANIDIPLIYLPIFQYCLAGCVINGPKCEWVIDMISYKLLEYVVFTLLGVNLPQFPYDSDDSSASEDEGQVQTYFERKYAEAMDTYNDRRTKYLSSNHLSVRNKAYIGEESVQNELRKIAKIYYDNDSRHQMSEDAQIFDGTSNPWLYNVYSYHTRHLPVNGEEAHDVFDKYFYSSDTNTRDVKLHKTILIAELQGVKIRNSGFLSDVMLDLNNRSVNQSNMAYEFTRAYGISLEAMYALANLLNQNILMLTRSRSCMMRINDSRAVVVIYYRYLTDTNNAYACILPTSADLSLLFPGEYLFALPVTRRLNGGYYRMDAVEITINFSRGLGMCYRVYDDIELNELTLYNHVKRDRLTSALQQILDIDTYPIHLEEQEPEVTLTPPRPIYRKLESYAHKDYVAYHGYLTTGRVAPSLPIMQRQVNSGKMKRGAIIINLQQVLERAGAFRKNIPRYLPMLPSRWKLEVVEMTFITISGNKAAMDLTMVERFKNKWVSVRIYLPNLSYGVLPVKYGGIDSSLVSTYMRFGDAYSHPSKPTINELRRGIRCKEIEFDDLMEDDIECGMPLFARAALTPKESISPTEHRTGISFTEGSNCVTGFPCWDREGNPFDAIIVEKNRIIMPCGISHSIFNPYLHRHGCVTRYLRTPLEDVKQPKCKCGKQYVYIVNNDTCECKNKHISDSDPHFDRTILCVRNVRNDINGIAARFEYTAYMDSDLDDADVYDDEQIRGMINDEFNDELHAGRLGNEIVLSDDEMD